MENNRLIRISENLVKSVGNAINITNKLLSLDKSKDALFYFESGNKKFKEKDFIGAIENYTKTIDIDPTYPKAKRYLNYAYFNRGNEYFKLKDYANAINAYTIAIDINPADAGAYNNRGSAKENLNDFLGAKLDYFEAMEINPSHKNAITNYERVQKKLNG